MSNNVSVVNLTDGRQVCLSYGVPVAAFIPGKGYIRTERKYSVTTSRHANAFTGGGSVTLVDDVTFREMIAPVNGGGM